MSTSVDQTINHLFRKESGKMVSVLVKIFGTEHITLAEDVVQDALIKALENWKLKGVPNNPRAWLYRTARNQAIDIIRKDKHTDTFDFSDSEKQLLNSEYTLQPMMESYWSENGIKDDFLNMMYACCHPEISPENQVSFILKMLCGFSTKEIAKSFMTSEDTISKRIYRTKAFFRSRKIKPQIPKGNELSSRTKIILDTIYLLFNEGYNSTHSEDLIREDIIAQAMILCRALMESKQTDIPEASALLALICFHASRNESRVSNSGLLVLLENQDRSTWNQELIILGNKYMNRAAKGTHLSTYHLEAAIAYEHCIANHYENTNWKNILGYYTLLCKVEPSPLSELNRCIVLLKIEGVKSAMQQLLELDQIVLQKYYLYHALWGELHKQTGEMNQAISCYKKAIALTQSKYEKEFLSLQIRQIKKS